jgi:hypothetical protein
LIHVKHVTKKNPKQRRVGSSRGYHLNLRLMG